MMKHRFWIGTYSANGGEGLISATIDEAGRIEIEGAESRIVDASYGLWCADLQTAWFVCEQEAGQVSGWRLENGRWVPLGSVSTGGAAPCFLDISPDHSLLAVANYESGSVATIVLDAVTGAPLHRSSFCKTAAKDLIPIGKLVRMYIAHALPRKEVRYISLISALTGYLQPRWIVEANCATSA